MIFRPEPCYIMVDVAYRDLRFDSFCAHRFEQQKRRRPCSVLRQRLVNPNADFPAAGYFAIDQMAG